MSAVSEGLQVLSYSEGTDVPIRRGPLLWAFALLFAMPILHMGAQFLLIAVSRVITISAATFYNNLYLGVNLMEMPLWIAILFLLGTAREVVQSSAILRGRGVIGFMVCLVLLAGVLEVTQRILYTIIINNPSGLAGTPITATVPYRVARGLALLIALPHALLGVAGWLYMFALSRLMNRRGLERLTHIFFGVLAAEWIANFGISAIYLWSSILPSGMPSGAMGLQIVMSVMTLVGMLFYLTYWPIMAVYVIKSARRSDSPPAQ